MSAAQEDLAPLLSAGLASLGLKLDAEQQRLLLQHLALIQRWSRIYNLTALREPVQMLEHHLLDSLSVVLPLRRQIAEMRWERPVRLLDVGSGAGLPGITLAIACPELAVTCVDAVGKKAGFIRQVGAELGLRDFAVVHGRVEKLSAAPFDVIVCRAFSSLADLVRQTYPLLAEDGIWLGMKGRVPKDEIDALAHGYTEVFHVEPLEVPGLNAERCIVWMRSGASKGCPR